MINILFSCSGIIYTNGHSFYISILSGKQTSTLARVLTSVDKSGLGFLKPYQDTYMTNFEAHTSTMLPLQRMTHLVLASGGIGDLD